MSPVTSFSKDWFPVYWLAFIRFGPLSAKPYYRWVKKNDSQPQSSSAMNPKSSATGNSGSNKEKSNNSRKRSFEENISDDDDDDSLTSTSDFVPLSTKQLKKMNPTELSTLREILSVSSKKLHEIKRENDLKQQEMKLLKITKLLEIYSSLEGFEEKRLQLQNQYDSIATESSTGNTSLEAQEVRPHRKETMEDSSLIPLTLKQISDRKSRCTKELEAFDSD
jgi:hypothetical protein